MSSSGNGNSNKPTGDDPLTEIYNQLKPRVDDDLFDSEPNQVIATAVTPVGGNGSDHHGDSLDELIASLPNTPTSDNPYIVSTFCVCNSLRGDSISWCGRDVGEEATFENIDQALHADVAKDTPCSKCMDVIRSATIESLIIAGPPENKRLEIAAFDDSDLSLTVEQRDGIEWMRHHLHPEAFPLIDPHHTVANLPQLLASLPTTFPSIVEGQIVGAQIVNWFAMFNMLRTEYLIPAAQVERDKGGLTEEDIGYITGRLLAFCVSKIIAATARLHVPYADYVGGSFLGAIRLFQHLQKYLLPKYRETVDEEVFRQNDEHIEEIVKGTLQEATEDAQDFLRWLMLMHDPVETKTEDDTQDSKPKAAKAAGRKPIDAGRITSIIRQFLDAAGRSQSDKVTDIVGMIPDLYHSPTTDKKSGTPVPVKKRLANEAARVRLYDYLGKAETNEAVPEELRSEIKGKTAKEIIQAAKTKGH